ncbi:MAG: site-specific integrase, partial [Opitutus sp.]
MKAPDYNWVMARPVSIRPLPASRATRSFAGEIDAFIAYIDLERGLSRHTRSAYQADLDQAAAFMKRRGVAGWRAVTRADAAAWVHSLSSARYTVASLGRKLSALRMLARFLVREKVREDDFTALLAGPKLRRRMPGTLSEAEVARLEGREAEIFQRGLQPSDPDRPAPDAGTSVGGYNRIY